MKGPEMEAVAGFIASVLKDPGNERVISEGRGKVGELCEAFPIYDGQSRARERTPSKNQRADHF